MSINHLDFLEMLAKPHICLWSARLAVNKYGQFVFVSIEDRDTKDFVDYYGQGWHEKLGHYVNSWQDYPLDMFDLGTIPDNKPTIEDVLIFVSHQQKRYKKLPVSVTAEQRAYRFLWELFGDDRKVKAELDADPELIFYYRKLYEETNDG